MGVYYSSGSSRSVMGSIGWIDLEQDSDRWWVLKDTLLNPTP
jgi:hypothetical protein